MFFFFLNSCAIPGELHSFPTRRSSDLVAGSGFSHPRKDPVLLGRLTASARRAVTAAATRSEEHTSELQSRRDLVCRLLLEKKKQDRLVVASFSGSVILYALPGQNSVSH